ncbi:MAG: hypothetical protein K1X28_03990 [Parachlamydiales bacterium]|nr:hypothetical protein [Parachlamydiales bacterium]
MCFSAESSFTSAGLLAGLTYAAASFARSKRQYPLVLIPFIFTLMQLSEGFTWLAAEKNFYPNLFLPMGAYFFLFISHFYLLLISPLVCFSAETNLERRRILKYILIAVCIVLIGMLYLEIISPSPPTSKIVEHSIQYTFSTFEPYPVFEAIKGYILLALLAVPGMISTLPGRWMITAILVASFAIAWWYYAYAFTSVWCFFATVISAVVVVMLYRLNRQ